MKRLSFILIALLYAGFSLAMGQTSESRCDSPEASQFDFWVGEWEMQSSRLIKAAGKEIWQTSKASNTITKELGSCVIMERFNGHPAVDFKGISVSVYDPAEGLWRQTWVDDWGGYMLFTGGMDGDKMILSREVEVDGQTVHQRMIFENIKENSFDWRWEKSFDGGENYKPFWLLKYKRKD
ncbi:MAG: DUF1579 domain-containing protein [candidate division Zixibacteria bacterium]|nr:DUF1579 domain-containing protein [candidate division Zixibacteria bacterium]